MANLIRNFVYGKKKGGGLDEIPKISGNDFKPNNNSNDQYFNVYSKIYVQENNHIDAWINCYTYNFERNKSIKSFKTKVSKLYVIEDYYYPSESVFIKDIGTEIKIRFVKNDDSIFEKSFQDVNEINEIVINFENGINNLKEIQMIQGLLNMYIFMVSDPLQDNSHYGQAYGYVTLGLKNSNLEYEITYF